MKKIGVVIAVAIFFILFSSIILVSADEVEVDELLSKCEIAPEPRPSVMVTDYKLEPEVLMPGDIGVLTITLQNTQDEPIEKEVDIEKVIEKHYPDVEGDIDTETRFTMDAHIEEAYIVERNFKVYNRYIAAGVVGPGKKVDLPFKIKAPLKEGIYMLKFIADIEDMEGRSSKGIRYYIPVTVSGTLSVLPSEISPERVELEVINEGLSDVDGAYVAVSKANGVEFHRKKIYIGEIKSGESFTAVFNVSKLEGNNSAVFNAIYRNGVNKHKSEPICVKIPYKGKERAGNHTNTTISDTLSLKTALSSSTLKLHREAIFPLIGLIVVACFLLQRRKREV